MLRALVAVWVGLALLVGVASFTAGRRAAPPPSPVLVEEAVSQDLTVHVAGAVVAPGVVVVPGGSRLGEAIAAAGGATPEADLGAVNLAEELADGTRVVVPRRGEPAATEGGPISLNRATAGELTTLPGIGPVLARRIVDHREASGPFESVDDLLDVSGIGERLLAGLRDLVAP